jgi:hypothetical protein
MSVPYRLLYSGFWFQSADMESTASLRPAAWLCPHMIAIGSGKQSLTTASLKKNAPANSKTYTFTWDKPGFGHIIAGSSEYKSDEAASICMCFQPFHQVGTGMLRPRSRHSPITSRNMEMRLRQR